MEITFTQPREITIIPESKQTFDKVEITQMIDYPLQKIVKVVIAKVGSVILWKGDDYDAIGQWTDVDVIAKIKEIYGDV
jgi:hypothetical protein